MLQITDPIDRYLQNSISNLQTSNSPWSQPHSTTLLWAFFSAWFFLHPTKDRPWMRPTSTFLYIWSNFGKIFRTNVIQFFSVQNMGHNQLKLKPTAVSIISNEPKTCCSYLSVQKNSWIINWFSTRNHPARLQTEDLFEENGEWSEAFCCILFCYVPWSTSVSSSLWSL